MINNVDKNLSLIAQVIIFAFNGHQEAYTS